MFLKPKIRMLCIFLLVIVAGCDRSNKNVPFKRSNSGYVQVDQGKLFYQKFGSGTPVIILHGGPGLDQSYLLPQMQALAKNHEVIFYDQRGSGKSLETKINPYYITLDQFTKDLEKLRKQLGITQFILLGHSWGGLLAMNYAIKYPHNLTALILVSTAPADFKGQQAFIAESAKRTKSVKNKLTPLSNYQEFEKLSASEIAKLYRILFSICHFYNSGDAEQLSLTMSAASAKSGARVREVMSKTSWLRPDLNLLPQLKKLNVPTLILHGQQDVIPLWTAKEIQAAIPDAKIITLKKCGHFPYIETPDEMFSQISNFLLGVER